MFIHILRVKTPSRKIAIMSNVFIWCSLCYMYMKQTTTKNNRETDSMRSVLLLVWIIVPMSELGIVRCDKTATELSKKITDVHFQLFKFIENQNKMLKVRMYNFDVCCLANRYSRFSITILLSLTLDGCV